MHCVCVLYLSPVSPVIRYRTKHSIRELRKASQKTHIFVFERLAWFWSVYSGWSFTRPWQGSGCRLRIQWRATCCPQWSARFWTCCPSWSWDRCGPASLLAVGASGSFRVSFCCPFTFAWCLPSCRAVLIAVTETQSVFFDKYVVLEFFALGFESCSSILPHTYCI